MLDLKNLFSKLLPSNTFSCVSKFIDLKKTTQLCDKIIVAKLNDTKKMTQIGRRTLATKLNVAKQIVAIN
jgi:hypothetical protein